MWQNERIIVRHEMSSETLCRVPQILTKSRKFNSRNIPLCSLKRNVWPSIFKITIQLSYWKALEMLLNIWTWSDVCQTSWDMSWSYIKENPAHSIRPRTKNQFHQDLVESLYNRILFELVVVLESFDIKYHQSKGFTSKAAEIRLVKNFKVKKEYWL